MTVDADGFACELLIVRSHKLQTQRKCETKTTAAAAATQLRRDAGWVKLVQLRMHLFIMFWTHPEVHLSVKLWYKITFENGN